MPTILTTSQKLSTGVDARNVRNIVLLRPINSMIEFKQIIGRGTRLFDGKFYFTIYDFVEAHRLFQDPDWDGEPVPPEMPTSPEDRIKPPPDVIATPVVPRAEKIKVKLADGKERSIQHMVSTIFWGPDGKPLSAAEFLRSLYGTLPDLFKSEQESRDIWSDPRTRRALLQHLQEKGFGPEVLAELQILIDAQNADLYDVLAYVAYALPPKTRSERAAHARVVVDHRFLPKEQVFLHGVLSHSTTWIRAFRRWTPPNFHPY